MQEGLGAQDPEPRQPQQDKSKLNSSESDILVIMKPDLFRSDMCSVLTKCCSSANKPGGVEYL